MCEPGGPSPEVDVVILSWNRPESTVETISNIMVQRTVTPRIWVVDQGSHSNCKETLRLAARQSPNIKLIELDHNVGVAAGRNIGMAQGTADFIVSLDNDAEFASKDALANAIARFLDDRQLGAIGFRIINSLTGTDDRLNWVYPRSFLSRSSEEFTATRFCGAGHAIRRSALDQTRGYDERLFFYWEETDLSYQLIESGYRIIYDPSIVVRHKISPTARTDWGDRRFYYLVRNALYLDWKYFRSWPRLAALAVGYQLKGVRNCVLSQSIRGALSGLRMTRGPLDTEPLSGATRQYLKTHDIEHRGSLLTRLRREGLERLP